MPAPDIQEMLVLRVRASVRRNELECRRSLDAGHRAEVKRVLAAAEELQQLLTQP
jgi:hypothetical protein